MKFEITHLNTFRKVLDAPVNRWIKIVALSIKARFLIRPCKLIFLLFFGYLTTIQEMFKNPYFVQFTLSISSPTLAWWALALTLQESTTCFIPGMVKLVSAILVARTSFLPPT